MTNLQIISLILVLICSTSKSEICEDTNPDCSFWADQGQCTANPLYMLKNCRLSCKECVSGRFNIPATFVSEKVGPSGPEAKCGYDINVSYEQGVAEVRRLIDGADICSQTITLSSKGVSSYDLCFADRDATRHVFNSGRTTTCHQSSTECLETIVVDDKKLLPITQLQVGDTGSSSEVIYSESVSDIVCDV